jgi:chemotaxis protein histidine kinase CheA
MNLKAKRYLEPNMSEKPKPLADGAWPTLVKHHSDYLATRKTELVVLRAAIKIMDFKVLKAQAHNWKGSARPYNFLPLEDLAVKLEECADKERLQECEVLLNEIDAYLATEKE